MIDDDDDIYETPPHELARTDDMDTAKEAAHRVDSKQWEKDVHMAIVEAGYLGMTQRDLERMFGVENNKSISPRFAPLRRKGLIFFSGRRRDRCSVWMDSSIQSTYVTFYATNEAMEAMAKHEAKIDASAAKGVCPHCGEYL